MRTGHWYFGTVRLEGVQAAAVAEACLAPSFGSEAIDFEIGLWLAMCLHCPQSGQQRQRVLKRVAASGRRR